MVRTLGQKAYDLVNEKLPGDLVGPFWDLWDRIDPTLRPHIVLQLEEDDHALIERLREEK